MDVHDNPESHIGGGDDNNPDNTANMRIKEGANEKDIPDHSKEELYNKCLQDTDIDITGMKWEEKKELAEVLLLTKDEAPSIDRLEQNQGTVYSDDIEGCESVSSEKKTETTRRRKSCRKRNNSSKVWTDDVAHTVKLRKHPRREPLGGNKIVVKVDVHVEGDIDEEPEVKERKLRHSRQEKREIKLSVRKKAYSENIRNNQAVTADHTETVDDTSKDTSSSAYQEAESVSLLQELTSDSEMQQSGTDKELVVELPSRNQTTHSDPSSNSRNDDLSESHPDTAEKIDSDDEETQPPGSPELFRDLPPQTLKDTGPIMNECSMIQESSTNTKSDLKEKCHLSQVLKESDVDLLSSEDQNIKLLTQADDTDRSQSPVFKKTVENAEVKPQLSEKKLVRKYRKYKEKIRLTEPLFSPPSKDPVTHAKDILKQFDLYQRRVRLAQSQVISHVDWGDPIPVGRHMTHTLDIKKRGQMSFPLSGDTETEVVRNGSQGIENQDLNESLPDIPALESAEDEANNSYLNREETTEHIPLESTLVNEQSGSQTLVQDGDDEVYIVDKNLASEGEVELRKGSSATHSTSKDGNNELNYSQSSNSILNSQGEIKPYQRRSLEEPSLTDERDIIGIIVDSDSSESSDSVLREASKKNLSKKNDYFESPEIQQSNRNDKVEITWTFDNETRQSKRLLFKVHGKDPSEKTCVESAKENKENPQLGSSSPAVSKQQSPWLPTISLHAQEQENLLQDRIKSPHQSIKTNNENGNYSSMQYGSPGMKQRCKKRLRESFDSENSEETVNVLRSDEHLSLTSTSGNTAAHTLTSSDCYPNDDEKENHHTKKQSIKVRNHIACPLCNALFSSSQIEHHASECEGPVIYETRKRKHHQSAEDPSEKDETGSDPVSDSVEVISVPSDFQCNMGKDAGKYDEFSDEIGHSAMTIKLHIQQEQMEKCMICHNDVRAGFEYEQHVDSCIKSEIEKNQAGDKDDDRRYMRLVPRRKLTVEVDSTWKHLEKPDGDCENRKVTANLTKSAKCAETKNTVIIPAEDESQSKEPNWLNAKLDSPLKTFKRISELEETSMDFRNQFTSKNNSSGSKGKWKSLSRGKKRKRKR